MSWFSASNLQPSALFLTPHHNSFRCRTPSKHHTQMHIIEINFLHEFVHPLPTIASLPLIFATSGFSAMAKAPFRKASQRWFDRFESGFLQWPTFTIEMQDGILQPYKGMHNIFFRVMNRMAVHPLGWCICYLASSCKLKWPAMPSWDYI